MKKLFIVLAVASLGFVACNNEGEKTESTVDSAALKAAADSAAAAAAFSLSPGLARHPRPRDDCAGHDHRRRPRRPHRRAGTGAARRERRV